MEVNEEKIQFFLKFFFDKGENASQVVEIANGVYGPDTVTANYVQFLFRRFLQPHPLLKNDRPSLVNSASLDPQITTTGRVKNLSVESITNLPKTAHDPPSIINGSSRAYKSRPLVP
ncbi:hypothetical protein TNCV_3961451 [Trichonephila clavipes]|nr:hypothetical protein TNCV_3961451 [Trichonephila clavipes]